MLVQLKGIARWELRRDPSGWCSGWLGSLQRPRGEAGGRVGPRADLPPPSWALGFSGRLRRLLIPQDGLWFAPELAGCVWSHSVRCWKGYIHPLFCWCLWGPHLLRCEATP